MVLGLEQRLGVEYLQDSAAGGAEPSSSSCLAWCGAPGSRAGEPGQRLASSDS